MKKKSWLLIVLYTVLFSTPSAFADFYIHHWENMHESSRTVRLMPELSYYKTNTNYDVDGTAFIPAELNSYSRMNFDFLAIFGLSHRFSLYARTSWVNIALDQNSDTIADASSYGLADQSIGVNLMFWESPTGIQTYFQLQADFPLYDNENSLAQAQPYIGDQSFDITPGVFAMVPIIASPARRLTLTGGVGYTIRSADFSKAWPWSVELKYVPVQTGFTFKAGIFGTISSKSDAMQVDGTPLTGANQRGQDGTIAGGSYFIQALNPSLMTVRGGLGFKVSRRTQFEIIGSTAFSGSNAPKGTMIGASATFWFGSGTDSDLPSDMSPEEYGKPNQGFIKYEFQAAVTKVNDQAHMLKIDKGYAQGVKQGQIFDIFSVEKSGVADEAIARGTVSHVKESEAALKIDEYFREVWIEEGYIAKRPIQ